MQSKKVTRLMFLVADYILNNDNEEEDYLRHCDENKLDPDDYETNSSIEGAHVYALAQELMHEANIADVRIEVGL